MERDIRHWEVGLLVTAWSDIDRALADIRPDDLVRQVNGGSSFAWTLGHVSHGIDSWINVRFQRMAPHPIYRDGRFLFGGDGAADDWPAVRAAADEIRERALSLLLDDATDLDRLVPYDGSYLPFREHGIQLRPAIIQNAVHHTYHLGEIAAKREMLGYDVPTFPSSYLGAIQQRG